MLQAVIFDFDGVISDTEPLHLKAFNEVLAQFDIEIAPHDYYTQYLGFTDFDCFKALSERYQLGFDSSAIEKLIDQKSVIFEALIRSESSLIEGVAEFLEMLKQHHLPIAICSGALRSDIEAALAGTGLLDCFDVIVTADDVENGKPDPEGFLLTLEKLNARTHKDIGPGQCVVIEDSHWGLQAAQKAEMHAVAVTNSYRPEQLKAAEKVVARLDTLTFGQLNELCS